MSIIKVLAIAAFFMNAGFVKFSVVSFCRNTVFKVDTEVCCHYAEVVLCCFDTDLLNVDSPYHSLSVSAHCSSSLMMSCHALCMHS